MLGRRNLHILGWLISTLVARLSGFVIAPPWANPVVNPCSNKSWQLLYWPKDEKCYQIFEQGPCPRSQELAFNEINKSPECRCPKDLLYWPATDRCYPQYEKGPCEMNQYLEKHPETSQVHCKDMKRCQNGWIFWPSEDECFELYSQGPCHKGDLLIMNPLTAEPYCGCDPLLLSQYYFPSVQLCYEHFTKGPCESGLLFAYNHTSQSTHCMCSPRLANFHVPTNECFQFGQKGPCSKGQEFHFNEATRQGECTCKLNYVLWPENGECYKAFTPGPCHSEEFIIPGEQNSLIGQCVQNPCPKAHLYFPERDGDSVRCHKVGSRGPCELGQLVVFEKYSGKSYRGECGCAPGYNQNYWPETGLCYEWYSQGPCEDSFSFQYNKDLGRTECVCDEKEGFVFWNETQNCYRVFTQGPCPNNAWLIPGEGSEVFCECQNGYRFHQSSYTCQPSALPDQVALPLLPFGTGRPRHWSGLGYPPTLHQNQKRPLQTQGWAAQGIFVSPGQTGIAKRVKPEPTQRPNNNYPWQENQWEGREGGWGAQALPRVGRSRFIEDPDKTRILRKHPTGLSNERIKAARAERRRVLSQRPYRRRSQ